MCRQTEKSPKDKQHASVEESENERAALDRPAAAKYNCRKDGGNEALFDRA